VQAAAQTRKSIAQDESMTDIASVPSVCPDFAGHVQSEKSHFRLPSKPHWIEPAVEFLTKKAILCGACEESRSGKLLLVLQEALANAMIHGNLELSSELKEAGDSSFAEALARRAADPRLAGRCVDVLFDYDGGRCRWTITDEGPGFDFASFLRRLESDESENLLASGRGILIMKSFMDELKYQDGGRRLVLTLYRQSGEEKRRQPRVDVVRPVRVAPIRADGSVDWDAAHEAVSLNFSESGMGLLQERLVSTERIIIGLFANNQPIYVPAEVRHCRQLGANIVELGCRFELGGPPPELPQAQAPELDSLQAAAQQAVAELLDARQARPAGYDGRRAHPRVVYNERIEILRPGGLEPLVGYARDLSRSGIAFITTMQLPMDVRLVMLPRQPGPALGVHSQIVRCNKITEGFYDVGARFLSLEPPA
jgi:anti-sigma regulatory factor (Ser/Thr protein kinase)